MTDKTEAMDLAKTLDELSAKATQGQLLASPYSKIVGAPLVATPSGRSVGKITYFDSGFEIHDAESKANGALLVALWNAYRTGKLVVVPDDAVERMAIGISDGLATRLGRVREDWLNESTRADAAAALAALKGADHAE